MFKVFEIAKKELLSFTRMKTSTLSILISPILIISLIGVIFSYIPKTTDITMDVCTVDRGIFGEQFIKNIEGTGAMNVVKIQAVDSDSCHSAISKRIREGNAIIGITLPENFSENIVQGYQQDLLVDVDNSRILLTNYIQYYVTTIIHEMSRDIGMTFISNVWEHLMGIATQLDVLSRNLETAQLRMEEMNNTIKDNQRKLVDVTSDSTSEVVKKVVATTSETELGLDSIKRIITHNLATFDNFSNDVMYTTQVIGSVAELKANLTEEMMDKCEDRWEYTTTCSKTEWVYVSTLGYVKYVDNGYIHCIPGFVASSSLACKFCTGGRECTAMPDIPRDYICITGTREQYMKSCPNDEYNEYLTTKNLLDKQKNASAEIENLNNTIQSISSSYIGLLADIDILSNRTRELRNEAIRMNMTLQKEIDKIYGQFEIVIVSINAIHTETGYVIKNTKETISVLRAYTNRNPSAVVTPLRPQWKNGFKDMKLTFLLPLILMLFFMFSCIPLAAVSLIKERTCGALEKSLLTPTKGYVILLGKFLGILIITALEISLVFAIAIFYFQAEINSSILELMIGGIFTTTVYIMMGFAIAAFTDSENTAILSTLTIGIPMFFLSGTVYPLAFMPEFARAIATVSPFTQGIRILEGLILYGRSITDIAYYTTPIAVIIGYLLLLSAIVYVGWKRSIS